MVACTGIVKDVVIMECRGDLNASSMITFKNKVRRLMEKNQNKVVLDLRQTKHVDLAGLGILVERIKETRDARGDIKLCNIQTPVRTMFKMVGIHKVVDTFSSQKAAVRSFQVA